jgi:hypothetical protein
MIWNGIGLYYGQSTSTTVVGIMPPSFDCPNHRGPNRSWALMMQRTVPPSPGGDGAGIRRGLDEARSRVGGRPRRPGVSALRWATPPDETWFDESTLVGDQADVFTPAS